MQVFGVAWHAAATSRALAHPVQSKVLSLAVVVLAFNEEKHLRRCLENIAVLAKEIFVVDSFSTDQTVTIAREFGAKVLQHRWENNYAKQFNWALENCPMSSDWVLRLDADEYLTPELLDELTQRLPTMPDDVSGIILKRRHVFLGKWIRRGTYPVRLLRVFRRGKAVCEQRLMDEHIQLLEGRAVAFSCDFIDHNLNDLAWWTQKHDAYALREALDLLDIELGLLGHAELDGAKELGEHANAKREMKHRYARLPLFWRAAAYFFSRYFLRGGFCEGSEGFLWHFLQGWWYRTLVDAKIFEIKRVCGSDLEKIREFLLRTYRIDCSKLNPFDLD